MEKAKSICPRCGVNEVGPHPALSRRDNKTDICPSCGQDEAIEAAFGLQRREWKGEGK